MTLNSDRFNEKMKEGVKRAKAQRKLIDDKERSKRRNRKFLEKKERDRARIEKEKEDEKKAAEILSELLSRVEYEIFEKKDKDPLFVMSVPPDDIINYYQAIEGISEGDIKGTSKIVFDFLRKNGYNPFIDMVRKYREPCSHYIYAKERMSK